MNFCNILHISYFTFIWKWSCFISFIFKNCYEASIMFNSKLECNRSFFDSNYGSVQRIST